MTQNRHLKLTNEGSFILTDELANQTILNDEEYIVNVFFNRKRVLCLFEAQEGDKNTGWISIPDLSKLKGLSTELHQKETNPLEPIDLPVKKIQGEVKLVIKKQ